MYPHYLQMMNQLKVEAVEELYLKILSTFNHFCPVKNKTISTKDARKP